jgi:Transposase zinc-binding domain
MHNRQPPKQILIATRAHWDRPQVRSAVRENFDKIINCRTPALGAEVLASETEEKLVYHTCKSRSWPSCGQRATLLWQREQWSALPDIPYTGIGLTMPDVLWPIFRQNRQLLHDLPALAAAVIQHLGRAPLGYLSGVSGPPLRAPLGCRACALLRQAARYDPARACHSCLSPFRP